MSNKAKALAAIDNILNIVLLPENRLWDAANAAKAAILAIEEKPWEPKAGDWVVSDKFDTAVLKKGVPYRISRVRENSLSLDMGSSFGVVGYCMEHFRPATPEEVEAVKPLLFGTRVKFKNGDGLLMGPKCDPNGNYQIAVRDSLLGFTVTLPRNEFTVLD